MGISDAPYSPFGPSRLVTVIKAVRVGSETTQRQTCDFSEACARGGCGLDTLLRTALGVYRARVGKSWLCNARQPSSFVPKFVGGPVPTSKGRGNIHLDDARRRPRRVRLRRWHGLAGLLHAECSLSLWNRRMKNFWTVSARSQQVYSPQCKRVP
ncbi:hypothetical protein FA95DRAFT_223389 [Auriscalpium vulgare]|uniref:Uncharacterized protein n=1 Tax=Auriscalpium vulgare TaxID=40419 RepID=A0ACB8RKJ1_9AGAM|nr:hypothetical protein FA95DRAFT_223389 [Auriscalpium vulgare]